MAKLGRVLLHENYGRSEYEAMIVRMQRYHRWWKWFDSIEDPREQMYVLLAEAQGTSAKDEQLRAAEDGFADTLEEWVGVVESAWRPLRPPGTVRTSLSQRTRSS